ncbi:MAG: hypothetical protein GXP31_14825 [Kiritimatiellaeota bacterium]|nr:hypothetical protein [Kiritimatiellota bacterium]
MKLAPTSRLLLCVIAFSAPAPGASHRDGTRGGPPDKRLRLTVGRTDGDFKGDTGAGIRRALAELKSRGGGTLLIKPGTYILHQAIELSDVHDITIIGAPGTLLKAAPGRVVRLAEAAVRGATRIVVEDASSFRPAARIEIRSPGRTDVSPNGAKHTVPYIMARVARREGNALVLSAPLGYAAPAGAEVSNVFNGFVISAPATDITICGVTIDMARGEWPKAPLNHTFHCAVFARGPYSYSKGPTGPAVERLRLVRCTIRNAHQRGVAFYSVRHSGVYDCEIENTGAEGIDFDHFSYYCEAVGNRLRNVRNLELNDASWCLVANNRIEGAVAGIVVWQWCTLPDLNVGNLILGNSIIGPRADGISCRIGADGNMISGNTVRGAGGAGILVQGRDNRIMGNTVRDCKGPALQIASDRNTVGENHVSGDGSTP